MKKSLKPGKIPLISKDLQTLLNETNDEDVIDIADDVDRFIENNELQIRYFGFARDLDLAFFILSDKRVLTRSLSEFPFLERAEDWDLDQYIPSQSGIHWTVIDADISLRGLLEEEKILTK